MIHTLLICSSKVSRNGDLIFIDLDGGQTDGGTTLAFSDAHAELLAKNILVEVLHRRKEAQEHLPPIVPVPFSERFQGQGRIVDIPPDEPTEAPTEELDIGHNIPDDECPDKDPRCTDPRHDLKPEPVAPNQPDKDGMTQCRYTGCHEKREERGIRIHEAFCVYNPHRKLRKKRHKSLVHTVGQVRSVGERDPQQVYGGRRDLILRLLAAGPKTNGQIRRIGDVPRRTVYFNLHTLIKEGLAAEQPHLQDTRINWYRLTEKGIEAAKALGVPVGSQVVTRDMLTSQIKYEEPEADE